MNKIRVYLKNKETKIHTVDYLSTDSVICEFLDEKYGYYSWSRYEFI